MTRSSARFHLSLTLLSALLAATACTSEDEGGPVSIDFSLRNGDVEVGCGDTLTSLGSAASDAELLDAMSGVLTTFEVETLWKRALVMREYFSTVIAERGEDLVIFDRVEPGEIGVTETSP